MEEPTAESGFAFNEVRSRSRAARRSAWLAVSCELSELLELLRLICVLDCLMFDTLDLCWLRPVEVLLLSGSI